MTREASLIRNVVFVSIAFSVVAAAASSRALAQFQPSPKLDVPMQPEAAASTRSVVDLLPPRLGANNPLVMLIVSEIQPFSWENMGGRGSIQAVDGWGLIFVSQTKEVHREIDDMLAVIRKARIEQARGAPAAPPAGEAPAAPFGAPAAAGQPASDSLVINSASVSAARQHIDAELVTETSLDFFETPLSDVAKTLAEQYRMEVVLDTQALEAAGITPTMPVTRKLEGIQLRTALWLLLTDLHMSYVIRDDVLYLTTPGEAESIVTRVYKVQDLFR